MHGLTVCHIFRPRSFRRGPPLWSFWSLWLECLALFSGIGPLSDEAFPTPEVVSVPGFARLFRDFLLLPFCCFCELCFERCRLPDRRTTSNNTGQELRSSPPFQTPRHLPPTRIPYQRTYPGSYELDGDGATVLAAVEWSPQRLGTIRGRPFQRGSPSLRPSDQ